MRFSGSWFSRVPKSRPQMSRLRGRRETNSQTLMRISTGREEKVIAGERICSAVETGNNWDIVANRGFLNPFFEKCCSVEEK